MLPITRQFSTMQYKALVRRHGVAISLCMVGSRVPWQRRYISPRHIYCHTRQKK